MTKSNLLHQNPSTLGIARCHILLGFVKHAEVAVHLQGHCGVARFFVQICRFRKFPLVRIDICQEHVVIDVLWPLLALQNVVNEFKVAKIPDTDETVLCDFKIKPFECLKGQSRPVRFCYTQARDPDHARSNTATK